MERAGQLAGLRTHTGAAWFCLRSPVFPPLISLTLAGRALCSLFREPQRGAAGVRIAENAGERSLSVNPVTGVGRKGRTETSSWLFDSGKIAKTL